jgi:trehalose 6-phosphate synthase/phosphatase
MIIAGIDTAQRLSGISLKLLAFERLLTDYPIWKQKIALVQKCLIPSSRLLDETNTLKEIRHLVKRIQDKFGPHVIDCEEIIGSSVPIDQRIALWNVADVLMITPIREGLNLLPLEYVYVRKEPTPPGVVISSEFSAVCSVLNGALRCNPFDIQMTVTTIDKALTMKAEEKQGRRIRDAAFVSSSPSGLWARKILRDLTDATIATSNNSTMDDNDSDDTSIMGTKFDKKDLITCTAAFLEYEKELAFCHLDMNSVIHTYNKSNKRVIILDLNGTIVMKEPPGKYLKREILGTSGQKPPVQVCDALTKLCDDPRNIIYVVSGDSQENVLQSIGQIPGLGLAASNGACFAPPRKQGETQYNWKYFDLGVEWEAVKKIVLPVLSKYTARSNGSFVKLTHSSIGWSYYSCDPEWGSLQASHLVMELEPALRPFDVRFAMIKGIVEIVPRQLNKGLIVRKVLQEVSTHDVVDFILCMGDDIHDEKMFTSVSSFIADQDDADHATKAPPVVDLAGNPLLDDSSTISNTNSMMKGVTNTSNDNVDVHAFTVAVGKKPSHAFAYVDDSSDVASLLLRLAGLDEDSQPSRHSRSFDYHDSGNYF